MTDSFERPRPRAATAPRGVIGSRTIGFPTLVSIVFHLPSLLGSAVIVWGAAQLGGSTVGLAVLVTWSLSGVLVFVRPVEELVAAWFFRYRKPTAYEWYLLQPAWERVCHRAGVKPGAFVLRIQNSDEANAAAAGGHIVAITPSALLKVDPAMTEGVLAHELGHHLKGHAWVGLLCCWYGLPGRAACRIFLEYLSFIVRFGTQLISGIRSFSRRTWWLPLELSWLMDILGLLALAVLLASTVLAIIAGPEVGVLVLMAYLQAAARRRQELQADLVALRLGYGRELLKFFYRLRDTGHDHDHRSRSRSSRLLATHPSTQKRIDYLEARLLAPWSHHRRGPLSRRGQRRVW